MDYSLARAPRLKRAAVGPRDPFGALIASAIGGVIVDERAVFAAAEA